ncbi:MAG TPA: DNA polymerase III subunit delta [Rhodanobacteraceae bacterium]|nr:DNA polymerase III subunit delta [Rhodanobacteraceae bacterium]
MPLTLPRFHQQLAQAPLPPAILLASAEPLLLLEAADGVRARAREQGYAEREVIEADARFNWDELTRSGATLSLFASRRLIDLRLPTGKPGKDGAAAIVAWCKDANPDTTLLVTCEEWSRKHEGAWVEAIDKTGWFAPLWPLKRDELPAWIGARLASRGINADSEAVALLIERTEGNLLAAAQEIDKLVMLHQGGQLDAATLGGLIADSARFDVFQFTDAALAGETPRALRMLAGLRGEGEEPIPMMAWIGRQLELALRLASAGDFASQARAEHLWPARERLFRSALRRAGAEHWRDCLLRAGRIDRIAKGREAGDVWRELERLTVAIAEPRKAAALA